MKLNAKELDLIIGLKGELEFAKSNNSNLEDACWSNQHGCLISYNEVEMLLNIITELNAFKEVKSEDDLPKDSQVSISGSLPLDRIRGMIKYDDCSMPNNKAERLRKHGVAEYNKAILDVLDVLLQ